MTSVCAKCGSSIEGSQHFCTKCGAPADVPAAATPKRFCTECGGPNEINAQFCTKCGKPLVASVAAAIVSRPDLPATPGAPSPVSSPVSPVTVPAVSAPSPAKGNAGRNILLALLIIVVLFVLATIGGFLYVGYRAKKKVDEIQQAYKRNDVGGLVGAVTGKGPSGGGGSTSSGVTEKASIDMP